MNAVLASDLPVPDVNTPETKDQAKHDDTNPDAIELGSSRQTSQPNTIFSRWQKRWISLITSFGAMFSTISSFVYLPALTPLSEDLNVSLTLMNLTVTSYMVVAGIAPAFMGDIADQSGRRPVYIIMFLLMLGANLGMANVTKWSVLLVLRMVLSAGASGTVSVAYGVLADITTAGERGSYIGTIFLFLGPVLGGVLAEKLGWRWIFWFMSILTGGTLVLLALFLPETQRKIVGNGSKPAKGIYRSLVSPKARSRAQQQDQVEESDKRGCRFPNPLTCLSVLADKGSLFAILFGALMYVNFITMSTSLAPLSIEIYDLNYLQAGLIYLPAGVSSAVSAKVTGKVIDWNFRRTRHRLGVEDVRNVSDIEGFPLEQTRLEGAYLLTVLSALTTVGYGLVVQFKTHMASMLVMQALAGLTAGAIFTTLDVGDAYNRLQHAPLGDGAGGVQPRAVPGRGSRDSVVRSAHPRRRAWLGARDLRHPGHVVAAVDLGIEEAREAVGPRALEQGLGDAEPTWFNERLPTKRGRGMPVMFARRGLKRDQSKLIAFV
ncbi:Quinidine resistance 1 [Fusarium albosuccineum]|uniref:Quinidine resistance 1 n=1 Tax=Fusarium albosuccineum TaxID=1237068 RepID=A0A8H4L7K9_9HYPO|nr:Quinidine resistance 1 [Fusarium albosuccineum]